MIPKTSQQKERERERRQWSSPAGFSGQLPYMSSATKGLTLDLAKNSWLIETKGASEEQEKTPVLALPRLEVE